MAGSGLMSDRPRSFVFTVGNGWPAGTNIGSPTSTSPSYTMTVVRLNVQPDLKLVAADWFLPSNAQGLSDVDSDFASGGVMGLPRAFGTDLVLAVGKIGWVHQLNGSSLGRTEGSRPFFKSGKPTVLGVPSTPPTGNSYGTTMGHAFTTVTAFGPTTNGRGYLYTVSNNDIMYCLTNVVASNGQIVFVPVAQYSTTTSTFGWGSSSAVVSSEGNIAGSGVVWVVRMGDRNGVGAVLNAYTAVPDSNNLLQLLKSIPLGVANVYHAPIASYGRVFIGVRDPAKDGSGFVNAYGNSILIPTAPPTPTFNPRTATPPPTPTFRPSNPPTSPNPTPSYDPDYFATTPPTPPTTLLYINCGSTAGYTDSTGRTWIADAYYNGGSTSTSATAIAGVTPADLSNTIATQRWGGVGTPATLTYTIPLTPAVAGVYNVTAYFAETYWTAAGRRVFDIAVQGQRVVQGLDLFVAGGGANRLVQRTFQVSFTPAVVAQGTAQVC